jgi:hypothetical protein
MAAIVTATDRRLTDLSVRLAATDVSDRLTETDRRLTDQTNRLIDMMTALHTIVQEQASTVEGLAALPIRLSELERSVSSLASATVSKPRLSVVAADRRERSVSVPAPVASDRPTGHVTDTDKGAFVRRCLNDRPTMRVSDIQRLAASQGMKIAHSYISDIRKAFRAEQDKQAQQETA